MPTVIIVSFIYVQGRFDSIWDLPTHQIHKNHNFFQILLIILQGKNKFIWMKVTLLMTIIKIHQKIERKLGSLHLFSSYISIYYPNVLKFMTFSVFSNNYTHKIQIDQLGWSWNFKLGPLPTFLSKKIVTFSEKFTQIKWNLILLKSWLRWKPTWPGGLTPSHQIFWNLEPLSEFVGNR